MKVFPNQLANQLRQQLAPFYMLFGEENYLLNQAALEIRNAAKAQGFDEIIRFSLTAQFDWQELIQEYASLSLFSNRKIIELELNDSKPNAAGAKLLKSLAESHNSDCILIFKGEKVGSDIQRTAWFKALDNLGVFIPCYPLQGKQLFSWLESQCRQNQLSLSQDSKALLVEYNQDNLFAISQEIEKLTLLGHSGTIHAQTLAPSLVNQSRLDVFDLSDALLSGNARSITKVMLKLKQENIEPTIVLWAIVREAQSLQAMQKSLISGTPLANVLKQHKVWKNKIPTTELALQRLPMQHLDAINLALSEFDLAYKQHQHIDAYQHILHIALMFVAPIGFAPPYNNKVDQYLNL